MRDFCGINCLCAFVPHKCVATRLVIISISGWCAAKTFNSSLWNIEYVWNGYCKGLLTEFLIDQSLYCDNLYHACQDIQWSLLSISDSPGINNLCECVPHKCMEICLNSFSASQCRMSTEPFYVSLFYIKYIWNGHCKGPLIYMLIYKSLDYGYLYHVQQDIQHSRYQIEPYKCRRSR